MKFLLGKKIEMTQMFDEKKKAVPVTLIEAGPCFVLQIKTKDKDGYEAVKIGFDLKKDKKYRHIREFKADISQFKKGDKIDVSLFEIGEKVTVAGLSKGKGFQGAVKKWGFHGRDATHGTKHEERTLGSIGSAFPQRVIKGKKMPGRMGFSRITVRNLRVAKINKKDNILALKGAVPGRRGTVLEIKA